MQNSYYLCNSGELKRHDNTLQLIKCDGTKKDIPIEKVYDIYVFSDITVNSDLMDFLGQKGVCLHFFNYYENYSGSFYPREKLVSGELLCRQVEFYKDITRRTDLAKRFVRGASGNILRNLRYYNTRGKDLQSIIDNISKLEDLLEAQNSIEEIMGIEGNIHKSYYDAWNVIINQEIDFEKRVKRPPDNMINALISFLNSIVYAKTLTEIYKTQLNPTISYLHEPGSKRFSLSLDVSEIFKPLIADRLIFNILNKNIITEDDFVKNENYIRLKPEKAKEILRLADERFMTTVTHKTLNREVSYRHLIRLELYKLINHLFEEKPYEPFKIWW